METLIHADIFFFVTTIFVIVLIIGGIIALYYITRILRNVHAISNLAKKESELAAADFEALREKFKAQGATASTIFGFLLKAFKGKKKPVRHYHSGDLEEEKEDAE